MKAIAIITARGGSKRIPKKNIREFCGKPIIAYSIEAALQASIFDIVMVSTDSEEIADVARQYGAEVPFMRSRETSDDFATTSDVILEVLDRYEQEGITADILACIYPTALFVTSGKLKAAVELMEQEAADSVIPVVPFSYPPQRGFICNGKYIEYVSPQYKQARSQDLETIYHDSGQFYLCRTDSFRRYKSLVTENTVPLIIDETEVQDIDNETDWKLAEMKFRLLKEVQGVPFV